MAKNSGNTRIKRPTSSPKLQSNTQKFIEQWNTNPQKEILDRYTEFVKKENTEIPSVSGPSILDNDAVRKYQNSNTINKKLRGLSSYPLSETQTETIKEINNLLLQSKLDKGCIVYRGTKDNPYDNKGYISTSTSPIVAADFGKIKAYYIPKGVHALWIGGEEKELLLPIGTNIKRYEI